MTDYSKMSDFEINKAVAERLSVNFSIRLDISGPQIGGMARKFIWDIDCDAEFNPCRHPEDAWPIIVGNEISIEFDSDEVDGVRQVWAEASHGHFTEDSFQSYPDENPLRAAMIVFLMMKEQS